MCNVPDEHGTQNNAKELTAFQYGWSGKILHWEKKEKTETWKGKVQTVQYFAKHIKSLHMIPPKSFHLYYCPGCQGAFLQIPNLASSAIPTMASTVFITLTAGDAGCLLSNPVECVFLPPFCNPLLEIVWFHGWDQKEAYKMARWIKQQCNGYEWYKRF
jgi:hypothetical protein